jgi:uncharacterized protein (TIGR02145 family)
MENLPNYLPSKALFMLSFVQMKALFSVICYTKKLQKVVLLLGTVNLFLSCSGINSNTRLPDHFCGVYEGAILPKNPQINLRTNDYIQVYLELTADGGWRLFNVEGEIGSGTYKAVNTGEVTYQNMQDGSQRRLKNETWEIILSTVKGMHNKYLTEEFRISYSEYTPRFGNNTYDVFCDINNTKFVFLKIPNQNISIEQRARKIPNNAIRIGNQYWMKKNLNIDTFQNGDIIPEAKTKEEWQKAAQNKQAAWCHAQYYEDGVKYGKLYNWYAIADSRGLAPKGWRIPSHADWGELLDYLLKVYKQHNYDGTTMKGPTMSQASSALRSGKYGSGNDKTGFSALPGGKRLENGKFNHVGHDANWWSVSEKDNINAYIFRIGHGWDSYNLSRYPSDKGSGFSVRCIIY